MGRANSRRMASASLGAFKWELHDMLKPERSQVGSKVAFRSLWYMGT